MTDDRIRTTISVDREVHEIFKRMAEAAGMSVSRMMGEWLADTADGAQFVAQKMIEARQSPTVLMREMQAFAKGMNDEVDKTIEHMRKGVAGGLRSGSPAALSASVKRKAPSSNTGLKSPKPPSKTVRKGK